MVKVLVLTFLSISLSGSLWSQGKWYRRGESLFENEQFFEASQLFEFSANKNPSWKAYHKLGLCLLELKEYHKAENAFKKALQFEDASATVYLAHGKALMNCGRYENAANAFQQYARKNPDDPRAPLYLNIQLELNKLLADSGTHIVSRLPFNSPDSDFGAVPFGKGLLFASARKIGFGISVISTVDHAPLVNLLYVEADSLGKWNKPSPLKGRINSAYNDGPAWPFPGDSILIFSRNFAGKTYKKDKSGNINNLQLLFANQKDQAWDVSGEFPYNDKKYAIGHPTLSADGKTLIFAANLPGGYGKVDLWTSTLIGDKWSDPVNLGPKINSPGDEVFPYLHEDGTLFFSSDEYFGLGGLDIFTSRPSMNGWTTPVNLGYPVNSRGDDFAYYLSKDRKTGYLSSNRGKGGKDDDIYRVETLIPDFECFPQQENYYCYRFFEPDTVDIKSLPVIYEWNFSDGNTAYGVETIHCFDLPGTYKVNLNLIDTLSGFILMNHSQKEIITEDIAQVYIDGPDTVILGQDVVYNGYKSVLSDYPDAEIREYFWQVEGVWQMSPEIRPRFDRVGEWVLNLGVIASVPGSSDEVKGCISRTIIVMEANRYQAITDSLQQEARRQSVSVNPSKSLVDSIRKAGLVSEVNPYGVSGKEKNTYSIQIAQSDTLLSKDSKTFKDLKEVEIIEKDQKFNYVVGKEDNLQDIYPVYQDLRSKGFVEALVVAIQHGEIISGNDSSYYVRHPESNRLYKITVLDGIVTDANNNPLMAEITLEDLMKGIAIQRISSDPISGKFEIRLPGGQLYGYVVEAEGYMPYSDYVDLRDKIMHDSLVQAEIKLLTMRQVIEQGIPIRLNNVFFDFDKADLRPESKMELNRLNRVISENPSLRVEIMGHTDWMGSGEYNLKLSEDRATSVRNYLISTGIPEASMVSHGYGETRPMAPNTSPEGRQLNRRVEFRFLPINN